MAGTAEGMGGEQAALDKDALGAVTAEVKNAAGDFKSAAVQSGRQLFEDARQQATSFADDRKNDAARSVQDIASSLRETGRGFEERPYLQAFVGNAADGLDQLASGIQERSFAEIYGEVEAYARRSPAVVGAVAVAAGFLLARFIKASADELSETSATTRASRAGRERRPAPSTMPLDA